jgi:hypothetical protein
MFVNVVKNCTDPFKNAKTSFIPSSGNPEVLFEKTVKASSYAFSDYCS